MAGDLPDFEGPRTLRYFASLLLILVLTYVIGVMLAEFYGFPLVKDLTQGFVENPMAPLDLAGVLSIFALLIIVGRFGLKHIE